ncbi:MAG TPA: SDR family oxidoreductase [Candidatus Hydrogenedentes bacterium]|nr:SDR family oxidoreductase [Candidatus Hydrogenedentota bacterium]HPG66602.1 SDR family oxidoreductase [Candidatus Hydrogenedentota bacterium]
MAALLENQVAIITGSGRGIGAAAAKLFAAHGAKVVVTDIDPTPAKAVVAEIKAAGGEALAVPGDITDGAFPETLVKAAVDTYGKLHILVNNAGYTWDKVVHKMSDQQWEAMFAIHCTAPFRLIRAAAPYMRDAAKMEKGAGNTPEPRCIINVSSTSGIHGNAGQVNYSTAKMGIIGLTKTIAKEWGNFNIRSNAVVFGMIDTRLTKAKEQGEEIEVQGEKVQLGVPAALLAMMPMLIPMGRTGTPEEAAAGIFLLALPMASYITGHVLEVTGGFGI